jgi:hypothetical protein
VDIRRRKPKVRGPVKGTKVPINEPELRETLGVVSPTPIDELLMREVARMILVRLQEEEVRRSKPFRAEIHWRPTLKQVVFLTIFVGLAGGLWIAWIAWVV